MKHLPPYRRADEGGLNRGSKGRSVYLLSSEDALWAEFLRLHSGGVETAASREGEIA